MLYERIRELASEKKISIAELERTLDFGQATIGRWRTQSPSSKSLNLVAKYFDVSMEYLLGESDVRNLAKEVKRYESFSRLSNEDVAKDINFLLEQLDSENYALLFDGDELDDETRELLIDSLRNTYRTAKIIHDHKNKE